MIIIPWTTSLPAFSTSSGVAQWPPLPTTGSLPPPRPNSDSLSKMILSSGTFDGSASRKSGRADRTRWIMVVASVSGGVKTSSTTAVSPRSASTWDRIGFRKLTAEAVLSDIIATFFGRLPVARSASSRIVGSAFSAWSTPVGEDWNIYLKPRLVIRSE